MLLRRPLPLRSRQFQNLSHHLTLAEVGALALLMAAYWPTGELPTSSRGLARVLGTKPRIAKRMMDQFSPLFQPGGEIHLLRSAHIVKAKRRGEAGKKGLAARELKQDS